MPYFGRLTSQKQTQSGYKISPFKLDVSNRISLTAWLSCSFCIWINLRNSKRWLFRQTSIQRRVSRDRLLAIAFFWNANNEVKLNLYIRWAWLNSFRKRTIARHYAPNGNPSLDWCCIILHFWARLYKTLNYSLGLLNCSHLQNNRCW